MDPVDTLVWFILGIVFLLWGYAPHSEGCRCFVCTTEGQ